MHKPLPTVLMLLVLACTGCDRNRVSASSVERQIGHAIQERCRGISNCTIRLRNVTSFDWDRMFYFDYNVPPTARETAVGVRLKTEEFRRQLVFLRGGTVIRNELLTTDIERPVEDEIAFESGKQTDWVTCDSEAQFAATRSDGGTGIVFFQLRSISADHCR